MAGTLLPAFVQQFEDLNGRPIAGAKLYSWLAGTTTPTPLFQNAALTAPHPWPAVADGAGRLTAFLPQTSLKLELRDATDTVVVPAVDGIESVPSGQVNVDISGVAGENLAERQVVYLSDGSEGPPEVAGEWDLADADETAKSTGPALVGVVVAPVISQGNTGQIRLQGTVEGFAGLIPGLTYYVSPTAGGITSSPPPNARVVGIAQSDTTLLLTPSSSSSSDLGVFTQLQVTGAGLDALVLAGGMQTGPGASVQLVGADGRIPAIDATRFANLTGVAKPASNETITGSWVFSSGLSLQSIADGSASAIRLRGRAADNIGIAHFFNNTGTVVQGQVQSTPTVFSLYGPGPTEGLRLTATALTPLLPVVDLQVGNIGGAAAGKIGMNANALSFLGGSAGHAFLNSGGGPTTTVDAAGHWSMTGRINSASAQPGFLAYSNATVAGFPGGLAVVQFPVEDHDTGNVFAVGTGVFTATVPGVYRLTAVVTAFPSTEEAWDISISLSTGHFYRAFMPSTSTLASQTAVVSVDVQLGAGVTAAVHANADGGATLTIAGGATVHGTYFSGRLLP